MFGWFWRKKAWKTDLPYKGLSVKEAARLIAFEEEKAKDPSYSDRTVIYDHEYNPGTLKADGTTEGREGSSFEYLWTFYQNYKKSNPEMAELTIMANWERKALEGGAESESG